MIQLGLEAKNFPTIFTCGTGNFLERDQKLFGTGPKAFLSPYLYGTNNFFSLFLAGRQRDHQLFLPWKTTGPTTFFI